MATTVSWNGSNYSVPATGEENWGGVTKVDGLLISLVNNGFQKTGGTFTLSADADFGVTAGLKSIYYKSRSANVSSTGIIRFANAETGIGWRNAANSGDLLLTVNSSNQLTFNGNVIVTSTGIVLPQDGGTGVANNSANTITFSGSYALTLTLSNTTSVTVPTSGTLATLAGSEVLTNKTLTTPTINGAALSGTLSGTPTFSGAIACSGQSIVTSFATAGTNTYTGAIHSDNTNGASNARLYAETGGASGGDAYVNLVVQGASQISFGIDNSDSDKIKLTTGGSPSSGTEILVISTAGVVTFVAAPVTNLTASRALVTDSGSALAASTTTITQLQYLSSATGTTGTTSTNLVFSTSPTLTTATFATSTTHSYATASTVPYWDASKNLISSAVTPTELGYVSGVTSAIQTQFGLKAPLASPTFTGTVTLPSGSVTSSAWDTGTSTLTVNGVAFSAKAPLASPTFTGTVTLPSGSVSSSAWSAGSSTLTTSGAVTFTGSTASTSTSTGILVVSGGVGIAGACYIGGGLNVVGTTILAGVTDASSAAAGKVGEYLESIGGSVSLTSNTWADATSLSITAGDWDITGIVQIDPNTATTNSFAIGVSTTSGNSATGLTASSNRIDFQYAAQAVNQSPGLQIHNYRVTISSTTTHYLKYIVSFATGTCSITSSRLSARRRR